MKRFAALLARNTEYAKVRMSRKKCPGWILLVVVLLAAAVHAAAQVDVNKVAQAVDNHYNSLRTMRVHFTQIYAGGGIERTEAGVLTLRKPGRMRWEYQDPHPKLFVCDGKDAWFYTPGERQARVTPAKRLEDLRSPLRYLLGHTKLSRQFRVLSIAPDVTPLARGGVVLRGVPSSGADEVTQVLIEVTPPSTISRLVIYGNDGSVTEFRFRSEEDNVAVSDSEFRFTPPSGVEVMRSSDLAQP